MYHWDPSDYEKNSSAQERATESFLFDLKLRGDERILDIGCGDGKVTAKNSSSCSIRQGHGHRQLPRDDRLRQEENRFSKGQINA